ncbi:nerve growth factor receptor b [Colossoma macropomum]|uniref:nerve growth factor receptor b n=1 Tax=Colossoma macropomum TaxID=42526 RepID=UPI001864E7C3|nr:nerve growth factor receptor b [Colossoma macropomum]
MLAAALTLILGVAAVFSAQDVCKSGQYTTGGECCRQCQPGEGMVKPCGQTQTECEPCLDSESFSENFSHTEQCQPCTQCVGLLRMETPCTDSNDAICVCDYGYFLSTMTGRCEACTVCPPGQGVLMRCEPDRDTVCEICQDDTFSDQDSTLEPCLPCTVCEDQAELEHCSPMRDTICLGGPGTADGNLSNPSSSPLSPVELSPITLTDDFTLDEPTDRIMDSTPTANPQEVRPGLRLGDNLIPLYVSILPAVVLGVVAFIIFKRWNSCKHNKQDSSNRSGTANPSQTPSPEGEKLHSDSGISVDSQSLQEGQGLPHTVVKIDGGLPLTLSLHTREEVEKLLSHGCDSDGPGAMEETDWCSLAGLLGYEEERIASFRQEERPIQALLSDWASQDTASVDTLCTALRKINREDIAQSIMLKPTATSTV